jgi:hypothetical protein
MEQSMACLSFGPLIRMNHVHFDEEVACVSDKGDGPVILEQRPTFPGEPCGASTDFGMAVTDEDGIWLVLPLCPRCLSRLAEGMKLLLESRRQAKAETRPPAPGTVKITLVGRPGRIVEKGSVVQTTMQSSKAPALPRGLPEPPGEPTTYVVYIAGKQWQEVAEAIRDPQDKLILEGYPAFDKRLGAPVVFATSVTTENLQATRRETP